MEINGFNIVNINFKGVQADNGKSKSVYTPKVECKNLSYVTPDFNVKTPQKYTSLGVTKLPCETDAHIYKLESGQKVVIVPKNGPTVVKTYVNTGSMNEADNERGISHFIEHSLFNGSQGLEAGEFFNTVNKMGANTNAATGFSSTNYYIKSNLLNENDLDKKIKIHASMLETPRFALEMIEKEKGPVNSEINMILDKSGNIAVNNSIKNLFGIKSDSKDMIGGTVDNINNLTREKVVKYYENNYYPANMVTVITGEVSPEETIKLVSKYFQSKAKAPQARRYEELKPIQNSIRNDIISPKATKTHISIAFAGPQNNNVRDKVIADAFSMFLFGTQSARLTKSLEKIHSSAEMSFDRISSKLDENSVIMIDSVSSEKNSEKILQTIFNEISAIANNPPTEEELNIVKKHLKSEMIKSFEVSSEINSLIGNSLLDGSLENLTDYEKIVDSMTADDIVNFAKKYTDLNKVSITVVHPKTTSENINNNYRNSSISFGSNNNKTKAQTLKTVDVENINKYLLPNNIELYTNDIKKDLNIIDINLTSKNTKNPKAGVVDILSIMLNKGSMLRNSEEYSENLDKNGINVSFACGTDGIIANGTSLASDAQNCIKSIKEVLLNPRLTQDNFEFAKSVIAEQLETITPNSAEGLMQKLFEGEKYAVTSEDIKNNLDKITLQDVKDFYNELSNDFEVNCAVSGPMQNVEYKNTILNELSTDFSSYKKVSTTHTDNYKEVKTPQVIVQNHGKSQAQIELGYKFKTNDNLKDSVTFILLETILGGTSSSRLFNDLREKQKLAYQVNTRFSTYDDSDVISLFIKTTTDDNDYKPYDNLQKAVDGFYKHINKLMTENVTEEELESAKLTYKNKILTYNETSDRKNSLILSGADTAYGVLMNNKALEIVDSITAEDIKAAANYIFGTKPVLSVVATEDTINYNKEYLKQFGEITKK